MGKTTRYTLKNNATDRTHQKFYIDHTADTAHGGFVITTQEHAVKSVTGFSRYQCALAPSEERVIDVAEEATYRRRIEGTAVGTFLKARSTQELSETGILPEDIRLELVQVIEREELRAIYNSLIRGSEISEHSLNEWRERNLVPAKILTLVSDAAEGAVKIKEVIRQVENHRDHVNKVEKNQERLRTNIIAMEKVQNTELVDRYLKDLN